MSCELELAAMAEPVKLQVLNMTPDTDAQKRKCFPCGKIISNISKLLSRKSHGGESTLPEDQAPLLATGKQLTSDLIVHPPANGKFTTVLQLNQVLGNDIKLIIVKVYGTKLQILGNGKGCNQTFKEEDLVIYGYICLPDYINSETLQFSINCFGDLQIKANIKGPIGI